jgi:hypothetical protein
MKMSASSPSPDGRDLRPIRGDWPIRDATHIPTPKPTRIPTLMATPSRRPPSNRVVSQIGGSWRNRRYGALHLTHPVAPTPASCADLQQHDAAEVWSVSPTDGARA